MKMICLPQFPLDNNMNYPKTFENSIITVGNDRNIRYVQQYSYFNYINFKKIYN